jgi:hypothetical protein
MKKIFFLALIFCFSNTLFAQKTKKEDRREKRKERIDLLVKQEEEGVIVNKKHFVYAAKLTTDGYGGFLEKGLAQSIRKALLFQLEITERSHAKEEKTFNFNGTGPYKYGKTNYFYPIKLGVQQQYLLGNKGNKNGVSVTANFGGGFVAALLRPYKLGFDSLNTTTNQRSLIYSGYNDNPSKFLSSTNVTGPGFGTGFNQLKVVPGIYAKTGVRFDYGVYNEIVSALEVGVTGEFYGKKISQMALNDDKNFFFGAYVAVLFGKRK